MPVPVVRFFCNSIYNGIAKIKNEFELKYKFLNFFKKVYLKTHHSHKFLFWIYIWYSSYKKLIESTKYIMEKFKGSTENDPQLMSAFEKSGQLLIKSLIQVFFQKQHNHFQSIFWLSLGCFLMKMFAFEFLFNLIHISFD